MNKCVKCGAEYDGNFCPKCGTPADGVSQPVLRTPEAETTPPQMIDPTLSGTAPAPQDSSFIPQPVNIPQPANSPQPSAGPAPTVPPAAGQPPMPPYGAPVQPPKKKNTCLIVGLCVGIPALVVIIIIAIILIVVAVKNTDNIPDTGSSTPSGYSDRADTGGSVASYEVSGASSTQNGVTVKIDRIDYTGSQTRIYVTVTNDSGSSFHLYQHNVSVTVNGKTYESDYNLGDEFDDLPTAIANGSTSSGVLFFPALDPDDDMTITIEAYTDDYSQDFDNYVFTIAG